MEMINKIKSNRESKNFRGRIAYIFLKSSLALKVLLAGLLLLQTADTPPPESAGSIAS